MVPEKFLILLFILRYLIFLNFANANNLTFPAHQFFNVSEDTHISKYLCNTNHGEKKCCSCKENEENFWCIDKYWKSEQQNLARFKMELTKSHFGNLDCIQIISFVPINFNHDVEHVQMIHRLDIMSCFQIGSLNIPVIASKKIYVNYRCAKLHGKTDITFLRILVRCRKTSGLFEDKVFTPTDLAKLEKCIFVIADDNFFDEPLLSKSLCPSEKETCRNKNTNFHLCKSYYAPYYGYKNMHCYKCSNDVADRPMPVNCSGEMCKGNQCIRRQMMDDGHPYSFFLKTGIDSKKNIQTKIKDFQRYFPIKRFFGSKIKITEGEGDMDTLQCGRLSITDCTCETDCHKYHRCCVDKYWKDNTTDIMNDYQIIFLNFSRLYRHQTCVSLFPTDSYGKSKSYFMITDCDPSFKDSELIRKCQSVNVSIPQSYIPVIGNDMYLYRNVYCLHCNKRKLERYVNITYFCMLYYVAEFENTTRGNCELGIVGFGKAICSKSCRQVSYNIPNDYRECELCRAYYAPIVGGYDNPHCLLCEDRISNQTRIHNVSFKFCTDRKGKNQPWSYLLSFNNNFLQSMLKTDLIGSEYEKIKLCANLEIDNITHKECLHNDLSLIESSMYFTICHKGYRRQSKTMIYTKEFLKDIQNEEFESLLSLQNGYLIVHEINITASLFTYDKIKKFFSINNITFIPQNDPFLENLLNEVAQNHSQCYNRSLIDTKIINVTKNCRLINQDYSSDKANRSYWFLLNENILHQFIQTCFKGSSLSKYKLKLIKLNWISNESIMKQIGKSEKMEMIVITAEVKDFYDASWLHLLKIIEKYFSLIGTSLSVLCALFVIFMYSQIERFQNPAGLYMLLLCIFLLFGDSMFILDGLLEYTGYNRNHKLCRVVGIMMHFGLLMVPHWSVVYSFSLMNQFRNFVSLLTPKKDKKVFNYFFATVIVSFCLVALSVVLDEYRVVETGYGYGGNCMPVKYKGRLLFYVIPATISFILSLIFSCATICFIKVQKMRNKRLKKDHNQQLVLRISFKLIVMIGLIEGLGFIQIVKTNLSDSELTFNAAIGFIYSFVRSARGFLLMITNLNRSKIQFLWQNFRKVDQKRKKKSSESGTQDS